MRRIIFTAVASLAMLATSPATVLAKHHSKRHHSRTHHTQVRHQRFGTSRRPRDRPRPRRPPLQAGTVDSFTGTKLVIKLTDGTLVSGTVTPNAEIECAAADTIDASDAMPADGYESGSSGDNRDNGDNGDNGDDRDNNGATSAGCKTANLRG